MPDDASGPGRDEDLSADSGSGHSTDLGSGSSHAEGGDAPHRAFGSVTPGSGTPDLAGDTDPSEAAGPSEGTPEDVRIGGERPGLEDEEGAPAGDHGRETAP